MSAAGAFVLGDAFREAFRLLATGDGQVYSAVLVSLGTAFVSTAIVSAAGIPLGYLLAARRFPGRQALVTACDSLLALPTVIVGLFVYAFLRRGSILGPLDLMFSPAAMVIGQVILALPLAVALSHAAIASLDRAVRETAVSLGAGPGRVVATVAWEARFALLAAVAAAGGRLVGEVGVAMMLGGNIAGYTRTLTTAIALETSKGDFAVAVALGLVLMALALLLNAALRLLQGRGKGEP